MHISYFARQNEIKYDIDISKIRSMPDYIQSQTHPMVAEKLVTLAMNTGGNEQIFTDGMVSFEGRPALECH